MRFCDWVNPENFKEAVSLQQSEKSMFIAGGTYLIPELADESIRLINLKKLLSEVIFADRRELIIGAGASLQEIKRRFQEMDGMHQIGSAAGMSCFSLNIRNQRTLGGEIARDRLNSEINTLLYALNARIQVYREGMESVRLTEWDGQGIITQVHIPHDSSTTMALERFAVLDSAAPIIVAAGSRTTSGITLAVGGSVTEMLIFETGAVELDDDLKNEILSTCRDNIVEDHLGSSAYKFQLIQTGISRVMEQI